MLYLLPLVEIHWPLAVGRFPQTGKACEMTVKPKMKFVPRQASIQFSFENCRILPWRPNRVKLAPSDLVFAIDALIGEAILSQIWQIWFQSLPTGGRKG